MSGIENFDDVRALEDLKLRELLERGRPEQRVWAIWALALRSTEEVIELAHREEPDAGVRRNLAVVLAGHGELDLLVALAKRDPAPEVRASAMQLVARLAINDKLPASLVLERARKDGAEVRIALLGMVGPGAPDWLLELAERMLADRNNDVRFEAFEALVRAGRLPAALMWLEEATESDARVAVVRWTSRGDVRGCADALAGSSHRLRRILVEAVRVSTWDEIAPVVGNDPSLIRMLAGRNPSALSQIPLVTLVRAALRDTSDTWIMLIRDRLSALETPDEVSSVLPDYRELCARRIADLDAKVARLKADEVDEVEMIEGLRLAFERAHDHAARLLVH